MFLNTLTTSDLQIIQINPNGLALLVLAYKLLKFYLLFEGTIKQVSNHSFSESKISQFPSTSFSEIKHMQNYNTVID